MRGDAYKCLRIGRCPEVLCLHIQRVTCDNAGQIQKLLGHVAFSTELDLYPYTVATPGTKSVSRYKISHALPRQNGLIPALNKYIVTKCVGGDATSADCLSTGREEERTEEPDVRDDCTSQLNEIAEPAAPELSVLTEREIHLAQEPASHPLGACQDMLPKRAGRHTYDLFSVVVHHGTAMSGHYTVFRKVKVARSVVPKAAANGDGEPEAAAQEDGSLAIWFQISDAQVTPVLEEEVLAARATLLFYEST